MTPEPKLTAKKLAENAAKELAAAQAKSDLLGRKSAEASAKFQAEAEGRRQKYMTKWLDEEFVEAGAADINLHSAQAVFEAAVEEATQTDPVLKAWVAYIRSGMRNFYDGVTAQNFASKVGRPAPAWDRAPLPQFFEAKQRSLEHLATRLESERQADIMDDLERAAEGDV